MRTAKERANRLRALAVEINSLTKELQEEGFTIEAHVDGTIKVYRTVEETI